MTYQQRRKPTRLPEFDYRLPGPYIVTICTYGRATLFGVVDDDDEMVGALGYLAHLWIGCERSFASLWMTRGSEFRSERGIIKVRVRGPWGSTYRIGIVRVAKG